MRISDWSSDVCSSDLAGHQRVELFSDRASGDVAVRQGPMVGFVLEGPVAVELHFLEEVGGRTGLRFVAVGLVERDGHARSPCRGPRLLRPSWRHTAAGGSGLHRVPKGAAGAKRSEEHTSELQSLMRISYAVFCL